MKKSIRQKIGNRIIKLSCKVFGVEKSWAELQQIIDRGVYGSSGEKKSATKQFEAVRGWCYCAINIINRGLINVGFKLYDKNTGKEIGKKSPAYRTLMPLLTRPNKFMTMRDLKSWYQLQLDSTGKAFFRIFKNRNGEIKSIFPLNVKDFKQYLLGKTTEDYIKGFLFEDPIGAIPYDEVVYFNYPDPENPIKGLSPIQAQARIIDIDEKIEKYERDFFENNARIDVALTTDETMEKEEAEGILAAWKQKYQGEGKAHSPAVLYGGLKVTPISFSNKDFEFLALAKWSKDKILSTFGVPEAKLGLIGDINRCVDEKTEILTKRGWLKYTELNMNDYIGTMNSKTEKIEYYKPNNIFIYDYNGKMHYWKSRRVDFMCTPNHKLYIGRCNSKKDTNIGEYVLMNSEEAKTRAISHWKNITNGYDGKIDEIIIKEVPYGATGNKGHEPDNGKYKIKAEIFAPFLGYYISEGCCSSTKNSYCINITQTTATKRIDGITRKIYDSMINLNMGEVKKYIRKGNVKSRFKLSNGKINCDIRISNKSLNIWLKENGGVGSRNKKIPECVFDWTKKAQQKFMDAFIEGDGFTNKYGTHILCTSSLQLLNDLQRLAVQLGYMSGVCVNEEKKWYYLVLSKKDIDYYKSRDLYIRRKNFNEVNYNGKIWCVDVPNHLFITRRNYKIAIHGNSNTQSAEETFGREALLPRLILFDEEMNEKVIKPLFPDVEMRHENPSPRDRDFAHQVRIDNIKQGLWTINDALVDMGRETIGTLGDTRLIENYKFPVDGDGKILENYIESRLTLEKPEIEGRQSYRTNDRDYPEEEENRDNSGTAQRFIDKLEDEILYNFQRNFNIFNEIFEERIAILAGTKEMPSELEGKENIKKALSEYTIKRAKEKLNEYVFNFSVETMLLNFVGKYDEETEIEVQKIIKLIEYNIIEGFSEEKGKSELIEIIKTVLRKNKIII